MSKGIEVFVLAEVVKPLEGPIQRFLERNPHLGVFASFAGFGTSVLAAVKILSVLLGFGGAVFGFVAGYYTMRSAIRKSRRERAADAAKKDDETTMV